MTSRPPIARPRARADRPRPWSIALVGVSGALSVIGGCGGEAGSGGGAWPQAASDARQQQNVARRSMVGCSKLCHGPAAVKAQGNRALIVKGSAGTRTGYKLQRETLF